MKNFLNHLKNQCICPLSHNQIIDPMIAMDGYTYQRIQIQNWLQTSQISPITGQLLSSNILVPNVILKHLIHKISCQSEQQQWKILFSYQQKKNIIQKIQKRQKEYEGDREKLRYLQKKLQKLNKQKEYCENYSKKIKIKVQQLSVSELHLKNELMKCHYNEQTNKSSLTQLQNIIKKLQIVSNKYAVISSVFFNQINQIASTKISTFKRRNAIGQCSKRLKSYYLKNNYEFNLKNIVEQLFFNINRKLVQAQRCIEKNQELVVGKLILFKFGWFQNKQFSQNIKYSQMFNMLSKQMKLYVNKSGCMQILPLIENENSQNN